MSLTDEGIAVPAGRLFRPLVRRWKLGLLLLALIVVLPYVFSRLASPWRQVRVYVTSADNVSRSAGLTPDSIRIACYNIAHGRGLAESNWNGGSIGERTERLDRIAGLLRELDADVVVLNEVDFDSSWSHGVNQAQYLAERAGYRFRAEQRNLDFRVLAWKWRFGNAILSRYPIEETRAVPFPGFAQWETLLAGKKRGLLATIAGPAGRFRLLAAHLCHRSESVRVRSADLIARAASEKGPPMIVAGDLNATPPGFPSASQDESGRNTIATLDASGQFRRCPGRPPCAEEMTFRSTGPRVVIDWILIPAAWRFREYRVVRAELSDHRPVVADVECEQVHKSAID